MCSDCGAAQVKLLGQLGNSRTGPGLSGEILYASRVKAPSDRLESRPAFSRLGIGLLVVTPLFVA